MHALMMEEVRINYTALWQRLRLQTMAVLGVGQATAALAVTSGAGDVLRRRVGGVGDRRGRSHIYAGEARGEGRRPAVG